MEKKNLILVDNQYGWINCAFSPVMEWPPVQDVSIPLAQDTR